MTESQKNAAIIGAIVFVIAAFGATFYYSFSGISAPISTATDSTSSPQATATSSYTLHTQNGDYTVTQVGEEVVHSGLDLTKPIAFSSSISTELKAQMNAELARTQANLVKKPTDFASLTELGNLHHMGGDENAAEEIWLYVSTLYPKSTVPFDNLGGLYLDYLKNYSKAESMFQKAIAVEKTDATAYRALIALYTDYGYKAGTTAAEDTLKQAIANIPTEVSFKVLLARYYVAHGRTTEAKTEFDAAIANAKAEGDTMLAAQIQQERDSL